MTPAAVLLAFSAALAAPSLPDAGMESAAPPLAATIELDTLAGPGADSTASPARDATPARPTSPPDTIAVPHEGSRPERERRGIGQRSWRALRNFADDCGYVAASPFRLRALGLAELGLVAGAEAAIYANDQAIMDAAQRNHDQPELHAIHKLGDILEDAGFMPHTLEA